MKQVITFIAICVSISFIGCTHRIGDFTVASTKNMDIKRSVHTVDSSVRKVGRDTKHIIFFIPTGVPNMKEAMDEAIEQTPGAIALSDVTVKQGFWWIPYIYGQQYFEVEGNPIFESSN